MIKALAAALESREVADFIAAEYNGAVVSVVDTPSDGYDASIDYAALVGRTVTYLIMLAAVILLILLVQIFQSVGTRLAVKADKRS